MSRRSTKWFLMSGVLASLAIASALVFAGHDGAVASYTGCLNVNGGTFVSVAPGSAPQGPCGPNQIQVHLSGGDITSVTAGAGLQGGSTNGPAQLSLQSSYRLPQGCSGGGVPKWTGTLWECATDADTDTFDLAAVDDETDGIPNTIATVRRLVLPAGKYAIFAKLNINFGEIDSDVRSARCELRADSEVDHARISDWEGDGAGNGVLSLMLVHEFAGEGLVELACTDLGDDDGLDYNDAGFSDLRVTAIKLGAFEHVPFTQ